MSLNHIKKSGIAALLFLTTACNLTQKMGKNGVPDIKTPNSKSIHLALMKTNEDGLHFSETKNGDLYSQAIELKDEYALRFQYKTQEDKIFVIAFNPYAEKHAQAQYPAVMELNKKNAKPDDLKIIEHAKMNYKVHSAIKPSMITNHNPVH